MKKVLLVSLVMVFALSFSVGAVSVMGDDNLVDFGNLFDTAAIQYSVSTGELNYLLTAVENYDGNSLDDGLDQYVKLNYGIADNAEVYAELSHHTDFTGFAGSVKYNFYNQNDWVLSGLVGYNSVNAGGSTFDATTLAFLSDKVVNDKLVLHNNFALAFTDGFDDSAKTLQSGLTYKIDDKNTLKALLTSSFVNFSDFDIDTVTVALNSVLNEKATYTGMIDKTLDLDNIKFVNQVEYKAMPDLTLTGSFALNTDDDNSLTLKAEKELKNNLSLVGKYYMDFADASYQYLDAGVTYKF